MTVQGSPATVLFVEIANSRCAMLATDINTSTTLLQDDPETAASFLEIVLNADLDYEVDTPPQAIEAEQRAIFVQSIGKVKEI
jgi:hypothetical protein